MAKKERRIVFSVGLLCLLIFTFTDLQISMAVATKPGWARVLEVIGEIPFTILFITACALLIRFRSKKNITVSLLIALGAGFLLFFLFGVVIYIFSTGTELRSLYKPDHFQFSEHL